MLESVKQKASSGFNAAKSAVGIQTEKSQIDEIAEFCPNLTWNQRIYGFAACYVIGYLITFMSFNFFTQLIEGDPVPFVVIYSELILILSSRFLIMIVFKNSQHLLIPSHTGLGNIISLCSAMFLCGPKRQFKKMFDDTRRTVTIIYLTTLAASIILCLIKFDKDVKLGILIALLITQFFSSIWYSLSYIPLARRAVKKFFRQQVDDIV
jgi:hypothetical protein